MEGRKGRKDGGNKERGREKGKEEGKKEAKERYFGIFTEVTKYNYLPNKGLRYKMVIMVKTLKCVI